MASPDAYPLIEMAREALAVRDKKAARALRARQIREFFDGSQQLLVEYGSGEDFNRETPPITLPNNERPLLAQVFEAEYLTSSMSWHQVGIQMIDSETGRVDPLFSVVRAKGRYRALRYGFSSMTLGQGVARGLDALDYIAGRLDEQKRFARAIRIMDAFNIDPEIQALHRPWDRPIPQ